MRTRKPDNTAPRSGVVFCHKHGESASYGQAGGERCLLCAKDAKAARKRIREERAAPRPAFVFVARPEDLSDWTGLPLVDVVDLMERTEVEFRSGAALSQVSETDGHPSQENS